MQEEWPVGEVTRRLTGTFAISDPQIFTFLSRLVAGNNTAFDTGSVNRRLEMVDGQGLHVVPCVRGRTRGAFWFTLDRTALGDTDHGWSYEIVSTANQLAHSAVNVVSASFVEIVEFRQRPLPAERDNLRDRWIYRFESATIATVPPGSTDAGAAEDEDEGDALNFGNINPVGRLGRGKHAYNLYTTGLLSPAYPHRRDTHTMRIVYLGDPESAEARAKLREKAMQVLELCWECEGIPFVLSGPAGAGKTGGARAEAESVEESGGAVAYFPHGDEGIVEWARGLPSAVATGDEAQERLAIIDNAHLVCGTDLEAAVATLREEKGYRTLICIQDRQATGEEWPTYAHVRTLPWHERRLA